MNEQILKSLTGRTIFFLLTANTNYVIKQQRSDITPYVIQTLLLTIIMKTIIKVNNVSSF